MLIGAVVLHWTVDPFWAALAAGGAFVVCGVLGERVRGLQTWLSGDLWWF